MNQERDQSYSEISLVDLATIFVRRIWLFVVVLGVFVAAGIAVALLQPEQYAYVSLYQIAEKATEEPVETPERVIAVLQ
ncbi:lipopolysaccharide biosynthesis protein, partial [bacterium LRH843]|nr:lipopolysaccharide biosynthesis protein [bacterium LRH843]